MGQGCMCHISKHYQKYKIVLLLRLSICVKFNLHNSLVDLKIIWLFCLDWFLCEIFCILICILIYLFSSFMRK